MLYVLELNTSVFYVASSLNKVCGWLVDVLYSDYDDNEFVFFWIIAIIYFGDNK